MMPLQGVFQEDFFQRIVNVKWVAHDGFFAAGYSLLTAGTGAITPDIVSSEVKKSRANTVDQDWHSTYSGALDIRSGSYALVGVSDIADDPNPKLPTPTFLMGGFGPSGALNYHGILISNDGMEWNETYRKITNGGSGVTGIVWDADARSFYACAVGNSDPGSTTEIFHGILLQSSDGKSWGEAGTWIVNESGFESADEVQQAAEQLTNAFKAHCTKPENRGGIPDGYQGYDSEKKIFMKPANIGSWDSTGQSLGTGSSITITGGDVSSASLPVANVAAVAFAGGVWTAFGHENPPTGNFARNHGFKIFASIDDGKTWIESYSSELWFPSALIGGAAKDVKAFSGKKDIASPV